MLFGTLFCLPALGLAQEARPVSAAVEGSPRAQTPPQLSARPQFDLRSASVQGAIRAAAAGESVDSAGGLLQPTDSKPTSGKFALQVIPFRAPRRMHHMKCDLSECVAYTADGDALYTVPREQYLGVNGDGAKGEWLSCQSGNDLLTTFERYDKCRGVSIGLPLNHGDTLVNAPLLNF